MAVEVTYESTMRPGTTVPCMYRIISINGQETSRERAGLEEVLASNPEVANSYRDAVKEKLQGLVDLFNSSSDFSSELHEEAAITLASIDAFVLSYSENMLPPVSQ